MAYQYNKRYMEETVRIQKTKVVVGTVRIEKIEVVVGTVTIQQ